MSKEIWEKTKTQAFKIAKTLSHLDNLVDVLEHPTKVGMMIAGSKFVAGIADEFKDQPWQRYERWNQIGQVPQLVSLLHLYVQRGLVKVVSKDGDTRCYEGKFADHTVGFHAGGSWCDGPYVLTEDEAEQDKIRYALAAAVWENVGTNICLVPNEKGGGYEFVDDPLTESQTSPTSQRIFDQIQKMRSMGFNRAILLHGESGVGKSYLVRDIIRQAGGLSLRIEFDKAVFLQDIDKLVYFLQPDALAIDDLDHARRQEAIFSKFERIKLTCPLFLVSVNDITKLDYASLRPGRFDSIFEITQLDDVVYDKLFGDLEITPEIKTRLKNLPIAYANEFCVLAEICGVDEAVAALEELEERRQQILRLMEDDGEEEEEDED